ncbi:MAG: hypothetical protein HY821_21200 [Acidobacteria bacterium]|nr:hypothetical protein [Acidobacteriota bacterium]
MRASYRLSLALSAVLCAGLVSCSSEQKGPQAAKPGTPAFFWAAANDGYKKGDFAAVVKNLGNIAASENEYKLKAQVSLIVINSGLARGDMEWADQLETGSKAARTRQLEFRKLVNTARTEASQAAMRTVDICHKLLPTLKDSQIPVAFGVPAVNKDKPVEAEKLLKGVLPPEAELDAMRAKYQNRGVLLSVARFGDPSGDLAKATAALSAADAKVARTSFLAYVAGELTELSAVFGPKKLDHAGRARVLLEEAKEALAEVPQSPDRAKLQKKMDEAAKKLPKP